MLIVNDAHLALAGMASLEERCRYCSKPLAVYPLIMSDDVDQTVYHVTCAPVCYTALSKQRKKRSLEERRRNFVMSLTPLARLRLAGRLCRLGSWFILAVGLSVSICLFFAIYSSYMADPSPNSPAPPLPLLLVSFALSGILVFFTSFFFILFFAVGAWLEYTSTKQDSQEKQSSQKTDQETNYEHVEITSLPR